MKYIFVIIVLLLFVFLFKKAAGTLKINKINIISFSFYSLLFFEVIGMSLIFLGYNDHYLIKKIINKNVISTAFYAFAYTIIAFPFVIYIFNRYVFKIKDINKKYENNLQEKVLLESSKKQKKIFICVLIGISISFCSTLYVFHYIGYVPLFKYFDRTFDFATERVRISRNFLGNEYIKNITMTLFAPLFSYISYIYYKVSKEKKWGVLFLISFILCIFVKTYNFEKAPIVYFISYFYLIKILLGEVSNFKNILIFGSIGVTLLLISYFIIGNYTGTIFSLSSGPLSRIIMTQSGTLLLHFDAFPALNSFLLGQSFSKKIALLLGLSGNFGIRSGRILMQIYNKNAILNGTAGVMSTMFLGEAYANFGVYGIILSPIIVGIIFSSIFCLYLKNKKTPLNMVLYLECLIIFTTVLQAGFVDFIFNVSFIIVIFVIFLIKFISSNKFQIRRKKNV